MQGEKSTKEVCSGNDLQIGQQEAGLILRQSINAFYMTIWILIIFYYFIWIQFFLLIMFNYFNMMNIDNFNNLEI